MTQESIVFELQKMYQLAIAAETRDGSYAGEFDYLDKLLSLLDINKGYAVDIAASDGFTQSSTLGFFKRNDWSGLAVEMDSKKFASLAFIYSNFPNVRLAKNKVTPVNIVDLLVCYDTPKQFDLLNLDIDSYDLYVIEAMLNGGFRPKVISMEINEKIPTPIFFTVDYHPSHYWTMDHFFGCSLQAAVTIVKPFGYILQNLVYNNAIFVRSDVAHSSMHDMEAGLAYLSGYKNGPDRKKLFPWNSDVDCWMEYSTDQAILSIKEYFLKYTGKYTVRK